MSKLEEVLEKRAHARRKYKEIEQNSKLLNNGILNPDDNEDLELWSNRLLDGITPPDINRVNKV